ncbi:MAG: hypothetical protein KGI24_02510 [Candidatus Omnitrophica bacterium]|nr:hypothetical protein [Candidatus Omnitrophota bacterium]MDE2215461.1 hypothetical protein [Candidatus Omnitrophota bacterium]MDE2230879.1 hypothetical protein [Candidatus Omnitrophota bacterium]
MTSYILNVNKAMVQHIRKAVSIIILVAFISTSVQSSAFAQIDPMPWMPKPGTMVHLSPVYTPAYLKGIVIHPKNPFKFDFIIYRGDKPLTYAQKRQVYTKLTKYFLASLAVPDSDQWVNLSPYEKDRIIKSDFGKTEMGRDLLAQDYLLKQITASLIYPESKIGKQFWKKVYAQAQKQYGTTDIPVNTFNKVWILPDDALIYEKGNTAYVIKNHLRVMLEEDYLSLQKHAGITDVVSRGPKGDEASRIIRQIVLPQLQKEVNEDKNFAPLRQVYSGMLLAAWFKQTLKHSLLAEIYANKGRVKGIDQDPRSNEAIYQQYLRAYKKGVFDFIKEDTDRLTNETIPRKYFSGGVTGDYAQAAKELGEATIIHEVHSIDPAQAALVREVLTSKADDVTEVFREAAGHTALPDGAMATAGLFKNVPAGTINPYLEVNRLFSEVSGKIRQENIKDVNGRTIQGDFIRPMLETLDYYAGEAGKQVESVELLVAMARVFNAIGSDPKTMVRHGSPVYAAYDGQIQAIVNAGTLREAEDILRTITPAPKTEGQPTSAVFKAFIAAHFQDMPKMEAYKADGEKVELVDLGSPEVQQMLKAPAAVPIIVPDKRVLTLYSDGKLLETAGDWTSYDLNRRIAVSQSGVIYFIKHKPGDRRFKIMYPFRLDYEDSGLALNSKVLAKVPETYRDALVSEVQRGFRALILDSGHPDPRPANLLVRIAVDDKGKPGVEYEPIDFDAAMTHGGGFLKEAVGFLNSRGLKPQWGNTYVLYPRMPLYNTFLDFLTEELGRLPFNNETGQTVLMRKDAREVVARLRGYLQRRLDMIEASGPWNGHTESIADIFHKNSLEVFKNEIYPRHGINGTGYNLDLAVDGNHAPAFLKLERRQVVQESGGIKVYNDGVLTLRLTDGALILDLERIPTSNVHYADTAMGSQQVQASLHRKFALIVYADKSTDWNGALNNVLGLREELEQKGYVVSNTRVDSVENLIEKVEKYSKDQAPDLLIIGAHGTQNSMHLGNGPGGYLTLHNVQQLRMISGTLAKGGTVVLQSCSTGKGESFEGNMANVFAKIFPQAAHVFAPRVPAGPRFTFDANNVVSGIKYDNFESGVVSSINLRTHETNLTERGYDAAKQARLQDKAMTPGGIDLNAANLDLLIKRDGKGMPLQWPIQDQAQFSNIQGLDPVILSIKPATRTPVFAELVS